VDVGVRLRHVQREAEAILNPGPVSVDDLNRAERVDAAAEAQGGEEGRR